MAGTKKKRAVRKSSRVKKVKLNLGSGRTELKGYVNIDKSKGQEAYPLKAYADESVDEVRASHLLEHFPYAMGATVLSEWKRIIKPGGVIKIAVPDFDKIARGYIDSTCDKVEGYLMGGQTDKNDTHLAIYQEQKLRALLRKVGFIRVERWESTDKDTSQHPISLNMKAVRPKTDRPTLRVGAAMSVPRLGFMDNFFSAFEGLASIGITLKKHTGAFWGQCLERALTEYEAEGYDAVICVDYDTIFCQKDVKELVNLLIDYPEADAIAPLQAHRTKQTPLMTIRGDNGKNMSVIPVEVFKPDLTKVSTAHFGLTIIRTDALRKLKHPWFKGVAKRDGTWNDGRIDEDIYFWRQLEKAGMSLYQANRIAVGHMELNIRWPGSDLGTIYQHPTDYHKTGKPEDVWT